MSLNLNTILDLQMATAFQIYPGFWTQIIFLGISVVGPIVCVFAYRRMAKLKEGSSFAIPKFLYLVVGSLTTFVWYVMTFCHQPRFPGLIEAVKGQAVSEIGMVTSIFGLCMFIIFFIGGIKSVLLIRKVVNKTFLFPDKLLTTGIYGIVRHPMSIADFIAHAGICLCTGAYYTTMLLPVYFVLNDSFTWIGEYYALKPKFPTQLEDYKK